MAVPDKWIVKVLAADPEYRMPAGNYYRHLRSFEDGDPESTVLIKDFSKIEHVGKIHEIATCVDENISFLRFTFADDVICATIEDIVNRSAPSKYCTSHSVAIPFSSIQDLSDILYLVEEITSESIPEKTKFDITNDYDFGAKYALEYPRLYLKNMQTNNVRSLVLIPLYEEILKLANTFYEKSLKHFLQALEVLENAKDMELKELQIAYNRLKKLAQPTKRLDRDKKESKDKELPPDELAPSVGLSQSKVDSEQSGLIVDPKLAGNTSLTGDISNVSSPSDPRKNGAKGSIQNILSESTHSSSNAGATSATTINDTTNVSTANIAVSNAPGRALAASVTLDPCNTSSASASSNSLGGESTKPMIFRPAPSLAPFRHPPPHTIYEKNDSGVYVLSDLLRK